MDCSPPGSSVRGILQVKILEWVAMLSSRGSSQLSDGTYVSHVSCIGRWILYHQATYEVCILEKVGNHIRFPLDPSSKLIHHRVGKGTHLGAACRLTLETELVSFKNIVPDRLPAFNTDFFFQVVHFIGEHSRLHFLVHHPFLKFRQAYITNCLYQTYRYD